MEEILFTKAFWESIGVNDATALMKQEGVDLGNMIEDIRILARTAAPQKYKVYQKTIASNSNYGMANNVIDIGADLKSAYGHPAQVPASALTIYASADIQIKFNDIANDEYQMDVSEYGKVWVLNRGDLMVYKIYFQNTIPSGSAPAVTVQVFVTGSPVE